LRRFYHFNTYCHAVPDPVPLTGDVTFQPPAPSMDRTSGPLLCVLEMDGVSTYPAIAFADVRVLGLNPVRLWRDLNIDAINNALATEPGAFESQLNTAEGLVGGGGYTGIIDRLSQFDLHFPPAMRKTPAMKVTFKLENQGHLPVDWSITYPTEKQVEVELWAEAEEPGARELRWMDIVNKKLFLVEPRKGALQPGDSQVLTVVYKYTHVDEPWELPVILQAKKGRRIVLNLTGTTLKPQARLLHFANKPFNTATHVLQPVSIGETDAPVQTVELYNPGTAGAEYEIDLAPVNAINQQNYGFEVLKIENPFGSISAGGYTKVRVIFCPLEAKLYQVELTVKVIGTNQCWQLTLQGTGFHPQIIVGDELSFRTAKSTFPRLPGFHSPWMPTYGSKTDTLQLQGQVAAMTPDLISFGWVPLFSKQHRLVMIKNVVEEKVTFTWDENAELLADSAFEIWPMEGYIEPGGHVICKVTYHPVQRPELIEAEISCSVQPEKAVEIVDDDLGDEEASQASAQKRMAEKLAAEQAALGHQTLMEKQQFATTVDGIPCMYDRNLPPGFEEDESPAKPLATSEMNRSSGGSVQSMTRDSAMLTSAFAQEDNKWKLYLNVEALAVPCDTYRKLHPKYDTTLVTKDTNVYPEVSAEVSSGMEWSQIEADLVQDTMLDLMKSVTKDLDVAHAFGTVDDKPVPYFSQWSTSALTPAMLRSSAALEKVKLRQEKGDGQPLAAAATQKLAAAATMAASTPREPGVLGEGEQKTVEGNMTSTPEPTVDLATMADVASEALALAKAERIFERNKQLAKDKANQEELQRLHRDDKFYYSVADILENTISNMVLEASFGEFDIVKAPRQLVTVMDGDDAPDHDQ